MPVNIEIKARCPDPGAAAKILAGLGADYRGTDHQIDTYFTVKEGRLKLREGSIEKNLIYYKRSDQAGPKKSEVLLYPGGENPHLRKILEEVLGIMVVVDKHRDIYFIDNVKFHIDRVEGLGNFLEIEAIGESGEEEALDKQCKHFIKILNISDDQLLSVSYSDLLLERQ
ncbi:MAG: adenylate cyclase [Bacteroidetes bacterium]|nr:MAG: adenylate cyclase [Bacteroidota bacterium]RLD77880.1 MAG: adenylate cyclase [Bacteroidota bacterium]